MLYFTGALLGVLTSRETSGRITYTYEWAIAGFLTLLCIGLPFFTTKAR